MAPAIRTKMCDEIKYHANMGSHSANWYIVATDLKPHNITKNTPRELAVAVHRLRLGYKANWELIDRQYYPCYHCEDETNYPLLHYLLECPLTAHLRGNRNLPYIHNPNSNIFAAKLCKEITEDYNAYSNTLKDFPPPR